MFCLLEMVSAEIQLELKQLYNALCELLRHFWACFPATTPALEEKVLLQLLLLHGISTSF